MVPAHKDEIEPSLRQVEGEGSADAVGAAGDESPRAVLDEVFGGSEEGGVNPLEEKEGVLEEDEEAKR